MVFGSSKLISSFGFQYPNKVLVLIALEICIYLLIRVKQDYNVIKTETLLSERRTKDTISSGVIFKIN